MMAEHILYTLAIVIITVIFYTKYTGKKYYWWIVILASFIPDIDHFHHFPFYLNLSPENSYLFELVTWIEIGDLHNILWLVLLSILLAGTISYFKRIEFKEVLLFCIIGYGIHLIEDFISYPPKYSLLYPIYSQPIGINLIPESYNLVYAGTEVLQVGGICILIALILYAMSNMFCNKIPITEEE